MISRFVENRRQDASMGKNRKKKATKTKTRRPGRPAIRIGLLLFSAALIFWLALPAIKADSVVYYGFEVVRRLPHDPQAYTQGLLYRDDSFFESTGGYGTSSLRRVDPDSGRVLERTELAPQYFGEGLAWFKGILIQLTWRERTAFVYDGESFSRLREVGYDTEGWGLTHDGERLIMSDGSQRLYFRDPTDFRVLKVLHVTQQGREIRGLNELEYIDHEIWANIYQTNHIVRISPDTGKVLGLIDLTGILAKEDRNGNEDVLNGIAYHGEQGKIFVTGKRYSFIYEIRLTVKKKS